MNPTATKPIDESRASNITRASNPTSATRSVTASKQQPTNADTLAPEVRASSVTVAVTVGNQLPS
jgi:hypothetical protein